MLEQARQGEDFRQATIYIRKITADHDEKNILQSFYEVRESNVSRGFVWLILYTCDVMRFVPLVLSMAALQRVIAGERAVTTVSQLLD